MKRFYRIGFIVLLLSCTHSLTEAQGGASRYPNGTHVGGQVVDNESGDGLVDVEVSVVDETGRTYTSTDGTFSIYVINANLCRLRFKKSGYIEIDAKDVAVNGNSFRRAFRMEKVTSRSVSGRVIDTEGRGIEEVEITVVGAKPKIYKTDKNGIFNVYTPDVTQIRLNARKNGFMDPGTLIRDINAVFVISEDIVLNRELSTPPSGRHILVLEKGAKPGTHRAPIKGVVAYVNMLPAPTQWGISNDKGYLIVNADPGDKITLKREGYVTIYNEPMPEDGRWIVEMVPEPWYEASRFVETDQYMRQLIERIYKACKMPIKAGEPNRRLEELLDSFQLGYKAIADFGYIQNENLEQIRREQYFNVTGPFRVLSEYINKKMEGASKWNAQRTLRDSLIREYEAEQKVIESIANKIAGRKSDPSVYSKIPELLRKAESSCHQLISISIDLRDMVGLDVTDIIERNMQSFQQSMDTATLIFKNELKDQPTLAKKIETEIESLKKTLKEFGNWAKEK